MATEQTEQDDTEVIGGSAGSNDSSVHAAPALLPIIWADPEHLPEHLAIFAVKRFGHRAAHTVQKLRQQNPDASRDDLMDAAIDRGVRITMTEGALMGGPIALLVPVAFVAAALAQAQMVLELAAMSGRRPTDRMRAADLLVIRRMAFLLGLVEPQTGRKPSVVRRVLVWVGIAAFVAIGLVLPLIWIPAMAAMFLKSTRRLGSRASGFYSEPTGADAGAEVRRAEGSRVRPVRLVFFIRTVLVALLPLIAALGLLLAGIRFLGNNWSSAAVVLVGVSVLSTVVWSGYRWWHRRQAHAS
jgi:hypothetical protein